MFLAQTDREDNGPLHLIFTPIQREHRYDICTGNECKRIELFFQSQKHPQCDANRTIHRCWTADHQKGCFMAVCDHQRWLVWKTPQFCTHNGNHIHILSKTGKWNEFVEGK